ncbi:hypothetical protein K440DRAFT_601480, partial [Wilcoxina mikolae CBS 423.85]
MSVLQKLGWFVAIQVILLRSLGSAIAVRRATNTTTSSLASELLSCSSTLIIPILQYVVTNYIAHAFTIRFSPGYGKFYTLIFSLKALIFPCFGLLTACRTVELLAITEVDPLNRALEAGALCTIARTKEWRPEVGDKVWMRQNTSEPETKSESETKSVPETKSPQTNINDPRLKAVYCQEEGVEGLHQSYINVHGLCRLPRAHADGSSLKGNICDCCEKTRLDECPEKSLHKKEMGLQHCQKGQYMLVRIPPHCSVKWNRREDFHETIKRHHAKDTRLERFNKPSAPQKTDTEATATESINQPYITLFDFGIAGSQSTIKSFVALFQLYSIFKILMANKLLDYGAYQLTLVPYALMSFINIVSGFVTPSYPAVYMVRSKVMEEAESRGGVFDGCVGELDEEIDEDKNEANTTKQTAGKSNSATTQTKWIEITFVPGPPEEPPEIPKEQKGSDQSEITPGEKSTIPKPAIISVGHFWPRNDDGLRMWAYFHHMWRSLPLFRFLKPTPIDEARRRLTKDRVSSRDIFADTCDAYNNKKDKDVSKGEDRRYYLVLQMGNAKHRLASK